MHLLFAFSSFAQKHLDHMSLNSVEQFCGTAENVSYWYILYFLCTTITEVNVSVFVDRLFYEDVRSNICSDDWREIFMKQPSKQIDKLTSVMFA